MSLRRRIVAGLLVAAVGCAANPLSVVQAFVVPSTSTSTATTADGRDPPTSRPYANGGDAPFAPFADILGPSDSSSPSPGARTTALWTPPLTTAPPLRDDDPLEAWGRLRLGMGTGPGSSATVYWVGEGAVYQAYSGRKLAILEGFDVGRGVSVGPGRIRQVSRKAFWFRDVETGEVLTEYGGKPVRPIMYDRQIIDYFPLDDGSSIGYSVEASKRPLKGRLPDARITTQQAGPHQTTINVPFFVDIPIPDERGGGRYRAWEFYDFQCDPSFPSDRPPTVAWTRQGPAPPFDQLGSGNVVMKFAGYRAERYEDLPPRMREEVERTCPMFRSPPTDEEAEAGVRL